MAVLSRSITRYSTDIFVPPRYTSPPLSGDEKPNLITGSAGSAGQVEGLARVILDPSAGDQLQKGEILVAVQTDISWTLLFPHVAAAVTDVGAPLSHAAIVARELGISAVVGCGDATCHLKTGDRVRVDGARGIVEILQAIDLEGGKS